MTKDQAIRRIQLAISELRGQGPLDRTSADNAIRMLEELREVIHKRQLDQRRTSVDSSHMPPPYRWG